MQTNTVCNKDLVITLNAVDLLLISLVKRFRFSPTLFILLSVFWIPFCSNDPDYIVSTM